VSGIVGWVGLIVPHIARRTFGSDARYALPAGMLIGGLYVVLCDTAARTVMEGEIPLGVLTSMLGAGLFVVLLSKRNIKRGKYGAG
jgi:iron complex transport system permease protein